MNAEEQEYLNVVFNYIRYYNIRAFRCKWGFYGTSLIKILSLSGITFLKVAGENGADFSTVAAVVTTMCLAIEGIVALFKWQEKWILYRNTQNALMREERQFATGQGIYDDKEIRFGVLFTLITRKTRIPLAEYITSSAITFISIIFWGIDYRTKSLIHCCEDCIKKLEEEYLGKFGEELLIIRQSELKTNRMRMGYFTYSKLLGLQFLMIGIVGILCVVLLGMGKI